MSQRNYLLYMAHGDNTFKNEVLASVLSYLLLKQNAPAAPRATVLIYTDQPDYFRQVLGDAPEVKYEEISAAEWQAWRGDINFVHRVKIVLLQHALANYGGQVLYLDSDTYFLRDEEPVFATLTRGQGVMHVREGVLSQSKVPLHQAVYAYLQAHAAPEWAAVSSATAMYNAGVIGLSASHTALLSQVLHLTDTLYRMNPSHVVEQFAFSYCLAQAGPVLEAAPYVLHYWHMKDIRPVLAAFFGRVAGQPLSQVLTNFADLPVVTASKQKDRWEARPRWQRGVLRALGRGWHWPAAT